MKGSVGHGVPVASSNRSFGFVFAAFFLLVGLLPSLHGGALRNWALILAVMVFVVALVVPDILGPFNRLWIRIGNLLNRIVSPIALGIMFFVVVMPVGLLMRFFGKDPLRLKPDHAAQTYWVERSPPAPSPESLNNQF